MQQKIHVGNKNCESFLGYCFEVSGLDEMLFHNLLFLNYVVHRLMCFQYENINNLTLESETPQNNRRLHTTEQ